MTECKHIYGFGEGYGGCSCDGDDYDPPELVSDKNYPLPMDVKFRYCPLCGKDLESYEPPKYKHVAYGPYKNEKGTVTIGVVKDPDTALVIDLRDGTMKAKGEMDDKSLGAICAEAKRKATEAVYPEFVKAMEDKE